MAYIFWEITGIFSSIAQKIWLSNFWSPSLVGLGFEIWIQNWVLNFLGNFLKISGNNQIVLGSDNFFPIVGSIAIVDKTTKRFLAPPKKFSGQIKKNDVVQFCHQKLMTKFFWSPNLVIKKLDDQKTLITFDPQNKFDKKIQL